MPECSNCPNEQRIAALEKDSERNQVTHKEFFRRFEDIGKELARSDVKFSQLLSDTNELKAGQKAVMEAIQAIENKPAKRWDSIAEKVIWAICAAAIGVCLARIGLA